MIAILRVYLSYLDLFYNHLVLIQSSVKDLEKGTLLPIESDHNQGVNMPGQINDLDRFKDIIIEAWKKIPV